MHYVIHCLDHEGAVEQRLANYDDHKAYLASAPVKTVISGPLLADDEQTMIGSCFVIEADTLAEVEAFNQNDPRAANWSSWGSDGARICRSFTMPSSNSPIFINFNARTLRPVLSR